MKKLILLATSIMLGASAFAQGLVVWANTPSKLGSDIGRILGVDGGPIQGAAGWAQLYAGADEGSLEPVAESLINFVNSAAGAGYFNRTAGLEVPVAAGQTAFLQVKAWEAGADSYEAAVTAGLGAGASGVFQVSPTGPPNPPAVLIGMEGFQLEAGSTGTIPEPSTIALGLIGAMGLMLRRRR